MTTIRPAIAAAAGLLFALVGCSGSPGAPSPSNSTNTPLTGSVPDAAGDAANLPVLRNGVLVTPTVVVLPDLLSATLTVFRGDLTGSISFAQGTLSHPDTFACVMLDVDENASTGTPPPGGDVALGYDYSVCSVLPRGSMTAQVSRLDGGVATAVGSVPVTFVAENTVRFTVPLSLLGGDDGRMAFKIDSMQWVDDPVRNTGALDWMPDIGRAAGLVR